jgi:Domain of unknown function (DUF4091)
MDCSWRRRRRFSILLAAATVALLASSLPAAQAAKRFPRVAAFDSLTTIRSDRPLPPGGSHRAHISAAGNEFESLQVVVQAGPAPLAGVRVDPGRILRGPGGATLPGSALKVYREVDYQVTQRSDREGGTGNWPDALVPETDSFYGEDRSAWPVDLPSGARATAWIDVLVPPHQRAGVYHGSIVVSDSSGWRDRVPLELRVRDFTIPSTSSMRSLFHISRTLPGVDQSLFAIAALNNRVTIANLWPTPKSRFASTVIPLLEGTDPRVQLPGARLTALDAYRCAGSCLETWRDLANSYPIVGERFIDYICDEPHTAADWDDCNAIAAAAEAVWPGVRKLVTTDRAHAPAWATDLSPVVDHIDRDGVAAYRAYRLPRNRKAKQSVATPRRRIWPYTSCMSFSCDTSESSGYDGWPGYAIDQPASQARAMGWMAFITGANGELYYNTTQAVTSAWTDQYRFGGNGDGTLFYPGTPSVIGGEHPIPVESMRLKRIRDGREDFEYMRLLALRDQGPEARQVASELFGPPSTALQSATVSSTALNRARGELAAMISG